MKLGVFGGAFDPPHLGHLKAARFFAEALCLDELLIVPAAHSPRKGAPFACDEARLQLCRLTFPFPVSEIEIARGGESYTADTLRDLRAGGGASAAPAAALFLLIGTDQLRQFTRWHAWEEILRLCTVCVLRRDGEAIETELPIRALDGFAPLEVSSTQLRGAIAFGEDASRWLAPGALAYINEKRLYTEPLLPPERLHHSRCVAEAAHVLAMQYGADPVKARFAGLWHDCAKHLAPGEQADPVTAHAFAGAQWLAGRLGVTDEEILGAVRWHTTGHAGMTLLEEVVFVADLISADRHYPDVETTRALAARDLHAASKYILEYVFSKCKQQGRPVHPASLGWYYELTGGIEWKPLIS